MTNAASADWDTPVKALRISAISLVLEITMIGLPSAPTCLRGYPVGPMAIIVASF